MENVIYEEWRPVKGFCDRYLISHIGRVYDKKRNRIKPSIKYGNAGYIGVRLWGEDGILRWQYLHRVLAIAFIKNTGLKPQINHKNGIKDDNRIENLEWCTISENVKHGFDSNGRNPPMLGKCFYRSETGLVVFINGIYIYDRSMNFIDHVSNQREAAKRTGISIYSIYQNLRGVNPYTRKYIFVRGEILETTNKKINRAGIIKNCKIKKQQHDRTVHYPAIQRTPK